MNNKKLSNKLLPLLKNLTKTKLYLAIFLVVIIFAIVLSPQKYIDVAFQGLRVWATAILPALFPFMIFTKILTSTGYVEQASRLFSPVTKKIYNCPGISSYVFLMSIISGYPLGAKITADLFENEIINRAEAHRISSFTSNSGPMFIVGTVGVGMLLSPNAGYVILISHILGALINGLLYRKYHLKEIVGNSKKDDKKTEGDLLSQTMTNGINSVLIVGGYIIIFFVITEALLSLGFFLPITHLLEKVGVPTLVSNGIITGLFEMTKGCLLISKTGLSLAFKTAICSLLISFGGLAISFQAFAFLNKFKISKKFYFLQKTTHAIFSFLICMGLGFIFL